MILLIYNLINIDQNINLKIIIINYLFTKIIYFFYQLINQSSIIIHSFYPIILSILSYYQLNNQFITSITFNINKKIKK
jgi:hypothetical protein